MDIPDEDLIHFWTILNKYAVQYLWLEVLLLTFMDIHVLLTNDVDLYLKDDMLNRQSLAKAFSELGHADSSFDRLQFVPAGWTNFYIGPGVQPDIMTSL
ncbi:MAG: hypothetical protein ABJB86_12680 [Bacteroidota bacterium]